MFKLMVIAAVLGALCFTNPPLDKFREAMNQRIDNDRSAMRTSVGFMRDITGITRLKQATGASSNHICRLNLYAGSLFMLKHASAAESATPTALGLGVAGQVYVKPLEDRQSIWQSLAASLGGKQCESFLIN